MPPAAPDSPTLTIEIFGGCCRLTRALRDRGFLAFALDHAGNQHKPEAPVVHLDFSLPSVVDSLVQLLCSGRVAYVHLAPPCGTCSAARDRPVPAHLRRLGAPEPKPLRSLDAPLGLPGLTGADLARVLSANTLYVHTLRVLQTCSELRIAASVENPRNSILLAFPGFEQLPS